MIERKFDSFGRVVIPAEMRRKIGIEDKGWVSIMLKGDTVVIKRATNTCRCCGHTIEKLADGFHDVCEDCAQKLLEAVREKSN